MTPKQDKFVLEYLKDLNATQAAIRAGYSEDTANVIGCENLTKPYLREAINKQLEESMNATKTELKSQIIGTLKDMAFNPGEDDIRANDRLKAMDLLGKYLAIWTEKKEIDISGGIGIDNDFKIVGNNGNTGKDTSANKDT